MTNNNIVQEATEAVEKGLPCAYLVTPLLDVVKSQKAEIDRLQEDYKRLEGASLIFNGGVKYVKHEAYREFAEKLKRYKAYVSGWDIYVVREHHIDNTLKELTEKNDKNL